MGKRFSKILKGQVTSSVFYLLLGLCLILMPVKTVDVICKVVFGLVLIGAGCYHVYIYVKEKESTTILDLFSGVIVLVLGGFLFYNPQIVVKLLPLLLGAFVLVDSIWTLQGCLKLKKYGKNEWKALFFGSLIFIVLGIAMIINPFSGVKYTVIFAGWVFLCNGLTDIAFMVLLHKGIKAAEEGGEDTADNKAESSSVDPTEEHVQDIPAKEHGSSLDETPPEVQEESDIVEGTWKSAEEAPAVGTGEESLDDREETLNTAKPEDPDSDEVPRAAETVEVSENERQDQDQKSSLMFGAEEPLEEWKD